MAAPSGCEVLCSYEDFSTSSSVIIKQDISVCAKTSGFVDEDNPVKKVRRIWSVNSKSGGSYVSVPKAAASSSLPLLCWFTTANGNAATLTVSATGEADSTDAVTKINLVKTQPPPPSPSGQSPSSTNVQEWFYLKFPDPQQNCPEITVSASANGVTASKQTNANPGTIFQVIELTSTDDSYIVIKNEKELYLSSDGAGNMKLKVWNAPIPNPPTTSDEVDPALLFRMVRPLGEN